MKTVKQHIRIDGVVPGVRGQRAFPQDELSNADPFLMLDHIGPQAIEPTTTIHGTPHPHRGFETVTIFLAGGIDHVDSLGHAVPLRPGDVQVMHAGQGILHGGDMFPDRKSGLFHEFQLWVNVPAADKMQVPSVRNAKAEEIPKVHQEGAALRVLTGTLLGLKSPLQTTHPTSVGHGTLQSRASLTGLDIPADHRLLIYVIAGQVEVDGALADAYQTIDFGVGARQLSLRAGDAGAEFLLLSGQVIQEPVAMGGPFVMNTPEEIEQAYVDFRAGRFGEVPPKTAP